MKGTVIILAVGDSKWGQLALSLCLSIKANDSEQKVLLVYEESAVKEIKPLIPRYFDYLHQVDCSEYKSNHEKAFYLKTIIYDIAKASGTKDKQFLLIDADCIILPSKKVSDWFLELKDIPFTAWCNDVYDFKTKTSTRNDYTFWCEPSKIDRDYGFMPQVNSSFVYFEICKRAELLFSIAKFNYLNPSVPHKEYKGVVADELCFNLACMESNLLPHQIPFYPIFFQFANEYQDISYIYHYYRAIGFAGEQRPSNWFVKLYNDTANYYRCFFGINDYLYDFKPIDEGEIKLNGSLKCLAKAGELPNSDGGVFNPDGIIDKIGLCVLVRKEKNLDAYKKTYTSNSAMPYMIGVKVGDCLLTESKTRIEDFRLFVFNNDIYSNYTHITSKSTSISISKIDMNSGLFLEPMAVELPIKTNKVEKNWVFFECGKTLYCIYSLSPYRVFYFSKEVWLEETVNQYPFDWFHKGHQISNSTNPIDIGEFYLMFFHSKEKSVYFCGAVLIDKVSLEIKHATKNSIHIMSNAKGLQDGLVYVSGSVYLERENIVRVYFGEADWNAWQIDFNKGELVEAIINSSNS